MISALWFSYVCFRLDCTCDRSMCYQPPPGYWAFGHCIANSIFPGLGLDNGTLWRQNVGGGLSSQTVSQQKLLLDEMVRMMSFQSIHLPTEPLK